jgi:hypothetical protein
MGTFDKQAKDCPFCLMWPHGAVHTLFLAGNAAPGRNLHVGVLYSWKTHN